jgi:competence protein ComEA
VPDPDPASPSPDAPKASEGALATLRASVDQPMEWHERLVDLAVAHFRARPLPWLVALLAVAGLGLGVAVVAWMRPSGPGAVTPSSPLTPGDHAGADASSAGAATTVDGGGETAGSTPAAGLVVQVAGAVVHPGVYRLASGSRVDDLITRAGGLAPDADGDRVNQAAALADGSLIYVPHVGQTDLPAPVGGNADDGSTDDASATTVGPPIDLNSATATQLDALPGVGPATAAAIVAYRRQHGPFAQIDDLANVAGIGPAKLAQIRPHVRV